MSGVQVDLSLNVLVFESNGASECLKLYFNANDLTNLFLFSIIVLTGNNFGFGINVNPFSSTFK